MSKVPNTLLAPDVAGLSLDSMCFLTSSSTILPPGPVATRSPKSTPIFAASFRAPGVDLTIPAVGFVASLDR